MLNALMNHFRHLRLKRGGAKISEKIQAFENFLRGNPADFTCGRGAWIEKGSKLIVAGDSARLTIGDFFYLNSYSIIDCHFSITIGARVQIGPLCYICDFDHDLIVDLTKPFHRSTNTHGAVVIKDNVWIGAGVKILKGVSIGENSVIAAGSVVTKNIPRNVVAAGVPAKIIKSLS